MLGNYKNILVPVDGSKEAKLAFDKAVIIAKESKAGIHMVHVIDTRSFQNISSFDSSMIDEATANVKKTLDDYLDQANQAGVSNIDYSIEYGAPKVVIAREMPDRYHTDVIIMGATGLSAFERLMMGSVTDYVSKAAKCDVLIVRTDTNNQPVNKAK
ncbi:universal stress protein [Nicoliella spurrieriana]|uniref:Universal stress protein n=1 Tax=Nicoliella spurrieriana TaxID=2925830 RepID=A0A976X5E9_9LACO|nr:universal stress protein [Nicoliella spurrieriana]UQS86820.1 universal stress protein [Nicoliella spurrieriana]